MRSIILKYILLLLAQLFAFQAFAQLIDLTEIEIQQHALRFNPVFIQNNGIQSVRANLSVKYDMQPVYNLNEEHIYNFNKKGLLEEFVDIKSGPLERDTSLLFFKYDEIYQLIQQDLKQGATFTSNTFTYNESGKKIKELTYKGNWNSQNTQQQGPNKTLVLQETYTHESIDDSTTKTVYINNLGKPYLEKFVYFSAGNVYRKEFYYLTTRSNKVVTIKYDDYNRIKLVTITNNLFQKSVLEYSIEYDEVSNVKEIEVNKNNKPFELVQYLYDSKSLLSAKLRKTISDNAIYITKYSYTYYE